MDTAEYRPKRKKAGVCVDCKVESLLLIIIYRTKNIEGKYVVA